MAMWMFIRIKLKLLRSRVLLPACCIPSRLWSHSCVLWFLLFPAQCLLTSLGASCRPPRIWRKFPSGQQSSTLLCLLCLLSHRTLCLFLLCAALSVCTCVCVSALGLVSSYRLPAAAFLGFPGGPDRKESACNAGDLGLIPGLGRSLEKEMATHSSILAGRISWTEEPGGLQSTGSQTVGHDWATKPSTQASLTLALSHKLLSPGCPANSQTQFLPSLFFKLW